MRAPPNQLGPRGPGATAIPEVPARSPGSHQRSPRGDPGDIVGSPGRAVAPGLPEAQLIQGSYEGSPKSAGPQGVQGRRPSPRFPRGSLGPPGGPPGVARGDLGDLEGSPGWAVAPGPPEAQLIQGSHEGSPKSAGPQGVQGRRPSLRFPRGPLGPPGSPRGPWIPLGPHQGPMRSHEDIPETTPDP